MILKKYTRYVVLSIGVLLFNQSTIEAYELVKCHTNDDCLDLSDYYTCKVNPKKPDDK